MDFDDLSISMRTQCLCGGNIARNIHHRDTENSDETLRVDY